MTASNTRSTSGATSSAPTAQARTRLAAFNASNGATLPWAPDGRRQQGDQHGAVARRLTRHRRRASSPPSTAQPAPGMGSVDAITGARLPVGGQPDGSTTVATVRRSPACAPTAPASTAPATPFSPATSRAPSSPTRTPATQLSSTTATVTPTTSRRSGSVLYTVSHAHDCRWSAASRRPTRTGRSTCGTRSRSRTSPDERRTRARRLRLELHRHPGLLAAAVVPRRRHRQLHRSEPGGLVGHRQQRLRRPRRRVPARERRRPAGPGPLRREAHRAQQASARSSAPARPGAHCPVVLELHGPRRLAVGLRHGQRDADLQRLPVRHRPLPIYTTTQDSNYWTYPMMGFIDTRCHAGHVVHLPVKVTDPFGNLLNLVPTTNSVTIRTVPQSQYSKDVVGDGATAFWRLGEASGSRSTTTPASTTPPPAPE